MSFGVRNDGPEEEDKRVFRVVVVSQLVPGRDWGTGRVPPLDPIAIEATTFDAVMGQLAPSLRIEVPDPFDGGAPPLAVDLVWRDRKAMRPNEIVAQVPSSPGPRRGLGSHRVVQDRGGAAQAPADAARAELARMLPRPAWAGRPSSARWRRPRGPRGLHALPAADAAKPPAASGLDALLDMVDVLDRSAPRGPRARSPGSAERDLAHRGGRRGERATGSRLCAAARRRGHGARAARRGAFRALVSSILRHPEVRRLERAWRGLRLLVENAEKRAGVEVDVVCATRDEVTDALTRVVRRATPRARRSTSW